VDSLRIKELASECGFDLCGITTAEVIPAAKARLLKWLNGGYHADMDYLAKEPERRTDPERVLTGAQSVIVLGLNYYHEQKPPSANAGRIAAYAQGRDYHKVFEKRLKELISRICAEQQSPNPLDAFRSYVDYGPLLERSYAAKAGLGFLGRNSMLITQEFGSWVLLGAILTTLELEPDEPYQSRHGDCGSCQRCITHCPTKAIIANGVVDARRCISYLTIEKRSEIDSIEPELQSQMGEWVFGCDVCQDVCPFNHPDNRPQQTVHPEFLPESGVGSQIDLRKIQQLDSTAAFIELTAGTPLTRAKLEGLKRNAQICATNLDSKQSS
jgi:epoxyqueuosine reductase